MLLLDAGNAVIHHADAPGWLGSVQMDRHFDLVFLDPPFHSDLLTKSCALLASSGCLAEDAIIYIEHAVKAEVVLPDNWVCLKQKSSGQVSYKLFAEEH
jgi:16S rRNA (guanine966-N2)-methyltransferase